MAAPVKTNICYLLSTTIADGVYMGGAMVTDIYGLPIEFRYTDPVVASALQRILYGDVLERYIQTDVILAHLIETIESKPNLYIPIDAKFLAAIDGASRVGVWLGQSRNVSLGDIGSQQVVSPDEILLQLGAAGSPSRVRFTEQTDAGKRSEAIRILVEASKSMDVVEPLRRIESALKLLWEESTELAARNQDSK